MFLRRLILVLGMLIPACALPRPYYHWVKDDTRIPCKHYVWRQMPASQMPGLCSKDGLAATEATSCEMGCLILSPYSEAQAEWVMDRDGMPIRDHEVKHSQGWIHFPER